MVADALSRKSQVNMLVARLMPFELAKEFDRLSLGFLNNTQGVTIELEPTLEQDIRKGQKDDEKINKIWQLIIDGKGKDFHEDAARPKEKILVVRYEKGDSRVCGCM